MKQFNRATATLLAFGIFLFAPARTARTESGVNAVATIGLLLTVVGVLGWVAWQVEKEDKADAFQSRALLPFGSPDADTAVGLVLDPESRPDGRVIHTAALALGVRF